MNRQFNFGDVQPVKYFWAVSVLLGLMLAFVSPDDELPYGWLAHLLHWQVQTVTPTFLAVFIHRAIGFHIFTKPVIQLLFSGFFTSVIFCPLAVYSDVLFLQSSITGSLIDEFINEFLSVAPPIMVFWLAINLPFQSGWQLSRRELEPNAACAAELQTTSDDSQTDCVPTTVPFMQLLPESIGTDLIYIKSELHYLKVVTTLGNAMILYPLRTAVEELGKACEQQPDLSGTLTHRSFWARTSHMIELGKRGREGIISVSNLDKLPVSRTRFKEVQARIENHA